MKRMKCQHSKLATTRSLFYTGTEYVSTLRILTRLSRLAMMNLILGSLLKTDKATFTLLLVYVETPRGCIRRSRIRKKRELV